MLWVGRRWEVGSSCDTARHAGAIMGTPSENMRNGYALSLLIDQSICSVLKPIGELRARGPREGMRL
jgi:hypothetical protein